MTDRSNHERLALNIVWGTRVDDDTPAADARELLAMCGLIDPDGREVLPDPETRRDVEGLDGEGFRQPASQVEEKITDRPKVSSAPPGLRDYAVGPEQPKKKQPRPALSQPLPVPVNVPMLDLPTKATRGTSGRCKAQATTRKPPTITEKCGKPGGYDAHRHRGEDACDACKAKAAERQREWSAGRAAAQGKPAPKRRSKATPTPATPAPPAVPENTAPATSPAPEPVVAPAPDPVQEPIPLRPVKPGQALAVELDGWFAATQRHTDPAVRRAANLAIAALIHLRVAMDDLARAERQARTTTHPTAGAQP